MVVPVPEGAYGNVRRNLLNHVAVPGVSFLVHLRMDECISLYTNVQRRNKKLARLPTERVQGLSSMGVICSTQGSYNPGLDDMDDWTNMLFKGLLPPLLNRPPPLTDKDLAQPKLTAAHLNENLKVGDLLFENPLEDDSGAGEFPPGQWIKLQLMQSSWAFPIQDLLADLADDEVTRVIQKTQLDKCLPDPNVELKDPQSDGALTRIAFYGLGAHRLEDVADGKDTPAGAVVKVDLLFMSGLAVRDGFEKYGACCFFSVDQNPVAIRTSQGQTVRPGDGNDWEHAKFVWRCSLILCVTAVDHLFNTHFLISAQVIRALVDGLPPSHALRRATQPFTFRGALINNKAGSALLPVNSILHHMTALTWDSIKAVAEATYKKGTVGTTWQPLPAVLANKGEAISTMAKAGKIPFFQDGCELFAIFRSFFGQVLPDEEKLQADEDVKKFWAILRKYTASPFLPEALTRNTLLDTLCQFAWGVTANHEHVGSISEYLSTPVHGGFRIRPGSNRVDKQAFLVGAALMSLTSVRTPPLLSKFPSFWKSEEEKSRWGKLQEDLAALVKTVDERNSQRAFPYQNANPKFLECAVSI
eukprot:g17116.t1